MSWHQWCRDVSCMLELWSSFRALMSCKSPTSGFTACQSLQYSGVRERHAVEFSLNPNPEMKTNEMTFELFWNHLKSYGLYWIVCECPDFFVNMFASEGHRQRVTDRTSFQTQRSPMGSYGSFFNLFHMFQLVTWRKACDLSSSSLESISVAEPVRQAYRETVSINCCNLGTVCWPALG